MDSSGSIYRVIWGTNREGERVQVEIVVDKDYVEISGLSLKREDLQLVINP